MSLAMEETTFHVGKPLPSAQSMPEEKGRVNAPRVLSSAGRVMLQDWGLISMPQEKKHVYVFFLPLCFLLKGGLKEEIIKL